MNEEIIKRHNEVVGRDDIVIHCGDFCTKSNPFANSIIHRLNGTHEFLVGSHDSWLKNSIYNKNIIWEKKIDGIHLVACHYAMRTWPRSHHGSIQIHGHSHGNLSMAINQLDVGVDNTNFYPLSLKQIINIIKSHKLYETDRIRQRDI